MTLNLQRFTGDEVVLHVGWRFIWRWSRILAAARENYVHGIVSIGPWMVAEW